ncbi:MAG: hypothetical protein JXR45_23300 [Deltaproteobacteria bacterium]|nr:hypothetical protein [Deltaproteobacteria bacterium]
MKIKPMRRSLVLVSMFLLVPSWGRADSGQQNVILSPRDCEAISTPEVERILQMEIRSITTGGGQLGRPIRVVIDCTDNAVELTVEGNENRRKSQRRIQWASRREEGRERVIAIAVTELVLSAWELDGPEKNESVADSGLLHPQLDTRKNADSADKDREKSAERKSRTANSRRRAYFMFGALWQWYPSTAIHLLGGEWGGGLQLRGPFELLICGAAAGGNPSRTIGTISTFLLGASLLFGARRRFASVPLLGWINVGMTGGFGYLAGNSEEPSTSGHAVSGGIGGPLIRFILASASSPAISASFESGYTAWYVVGQVDSAAAVAIKGWWGAASLNIILFRK